MKCVRAMDSLEDPENVPQISLTQSYGKGILIAFQEQVEYQLTNVQSSYIDPNGIKKAVVIPKWIKSESGESTFAWKIFHRGVFRSAMMRWYHKEYKINTDDIEKVFRHLGLKPALTFRSRSSQDIAKAQRTRAQSHLIKSRMAEHAENGSSRRGAFRSKSVHAGSPQDGTLQREIKHSIVNMPDQNKRYYSDK